MVAARAIAGCCLSALVVSGTSYAAAAAGDELSYQAKEEIIAPVRAWVGQLKESKNDAGKPNKKGAYSRLLRKIDGSTYEVGVHVNTARDTSQLTERYALTLKKKATGTGWEVAEAKVIDTYVGLYRESHTACNPFQRFSFDREGMKVSAANGTVCETYLEGKVTWFAVNGNAMTYEYTPPEHAGLVQTGHDFYAIHKVMAKDHARELSVTPAAFFFQCDGQTCEELLKECFTGLNRPTAAEAPGQRLGDSLSGPQWLRPLADRYMKDVNENAFAGFRPLDEPGHRYYGLLVAREVQPLDWPFLEEIIPGSGVILVKDNWGGWELQFIVLPRRIDVPFQLVGPLYGYYSEETAKTQDPSEIERREDVDTRWYEVNSVKGTIGLGIENDEMIDGDVDFGLTLKQNVRELPFFINSFSERDLVGKDKPAPLFVNSIQLDGKELTWVSTGSTSGRVILPQEMPAGSNLKLRMNYSTKGMRKYTHSFSYVDRFGWMPFVSFGDFIDEWDLIIKSPSQYDILGIGKKISEKTEGDVKVSHWKSERPVVFASIIMGRYQTDTPGPKFELPKKADGTTIPVAVHIDEGSFGQWGITPNSLRPIAEQAANSINLYADISGLEYPYGELNLVNDPLGTLYGQAPSSLIYLGSGVFRGEGFLATLPFFENATDITKFLKSVTAHEVGHQWWGSRVSNANQRNYWFVESLAEYFSAIYLEAVYGWKEYEEQVEDWRRAILKTDLDGSVQNANTLHSGDDGFSSYQASVYSKGPFAFHMLREIFKGEGPRGPEGADKKFFDALKVFSKKLSEKREIVTMDIQQAAEESLGGIGPNGKPYKVDLSWFFNQWIRGAGIPQYMLSYNVRETEDGAFLVEGLIKQRVVIGNKSAPKLLENTYYRGVTELTVKTNDEDYVKRVVVDGPETTFKLKVPKKPVVVTLNQNGGILAHDVLVNKSW